MVKKAGLDEDSPANFLNNISKLIERLFLSRLNLGYLVLPTSIIYSLHIDSITQLKPLFYSALITSTKLLITANLHYSSHSIYKCCLRHNRPLLLLSRLQTSFGFSGTALSWLTSYLSNRSQLVRIGQSSSLPSSLDSGVGLP